MAKKQVTSRFKRDPNKVLVGITHGRSGYGRGCMCDICREAEREYQLARKADGGASADNVHQLRSIGGVQQVPKPKTRTTTNGWDGEIGLMEQAVIDECEGLSLAAERPAMVMAARLQARLCDDHKSQGLWTSASRQLTAILNDLRGNSKRKTKGRLAQVQRMTTKAAGA